MTDAFGAWPYRWFGCWREFGPSYARCPTIEDFIDPSWAYGDRDRLVRYLVGAPIVATTSRLGLPWAKGQGDDRSSVSYRSDGVWVWLDDLDYYIIEQSLRLPDSFVAAIEGRDFEPPTDLDIDPMALSWPPTD
jgi:hypothetical protein